MNPSGVETETSERLTADERRELLLDVARDLVHDLGPANVTMGSVAERAEVTRALVYKHFDNKDDLLVALYRREAQRLDTQIRVAVEAAPHGFEPKLRAMVGATLDAVDEHAAFFDPLRRAGRDPSARRDRRGRDSRTVTYFVELATAEYRTDPDTTRTAIKVLFSGIDSLLAQLRSRPGGTQRRILEDTYVDIVIGALVHLRDRSIS